MADSLTLDIEGLTPDQVAHLVKVAQEMREDNQLEEIDWDDESWRDAPSTGWTAEHVELLRAALFERGKPTQLAAFDAAVENGGYVPRKEVYELGGYAPTRKLNNWTAPFKAIVAELVAHHGLPEAAAQPMEPEYGPGTGFRPALGFNVAPEIVRLARE